MLATGRLPIQGRLTSRRSGALSGRQHLADLLRQPVLGDHCKATGSSFGSYPTDFNGLSWTPSDNKKGRNPYFLEVSGLVWTCWDDYLVPEIGIEPTTYALRMRRSTN